jgi:hypothetical protein
MAKKGSRGSKRAMAASKWTELERAFIIVILILVVVTAYALVFPEEIVEVGSIETYSGAVDLRDDMNDVNTSYSFERQLLLDYQVRVQYEIPFHTDEFGPTVYFKVWNSTTGDTLIQKTTDTIFNKNIRIDSEDAGTYEFIWWVDGGHGVSRVEFDVLIQPTEKIFEKRT